jgi:hypothetical protein
LDAARGDWIAGLLRKERVGRYDRYVLESSKVSDEELERLQEVAGHADAPEDDEDIPF